MLVRFLKLTIDEYDENFDDYDYSKAKFMTYKKIKEVSEFAKLLKNVGQVEIDDEWYLVKDYSIKIVGNDEDNGVIFNVYLEEYM